MCENNNCTKPQVVHCCITTVKYITALFSFANLINFIENKITESLHDYVLPVVPKFL